MANHVYLFFNSLYYQSNTFEEEKENVNPSIIIFIILIRLNLEIQLTMQISEKTERRFGVILAPLSNKECDRKDDFYRK